MEFEVINTQAVQRPETEKTSRPNRRHPMIAPQVIHASRGALRQKGHLAGHVTAAATTWWVSDDVSRQNRTSKVSAACQSKAGVSAEQWTAWPGCADVSLAISRTPSSSIRHVAVAPSGGVARTEACCSATTTDSCRHSDPSPSSVSVSWAPSRRTSGASPRCSAP